MWMPTLFIVIELLLLSIIAKRSTQEAFTILMRIVRSRRIAITIMTIVLFPGTVIHELSHLFTAEILGVRTGELTLAPESITGDRIQSGSVAIAHTDPFRRTLIGLAPFFTGVTSLLALSWWFVAITRDHTLILLDIRFSIILIVYLVATITNTMFASPEDMQGVIPVFGTLLILAVGGYLAGIRFVLPEPIMIQISSILLSCAQNLGIVLTFHLVTLLLYTSINLIIRSH